MSLNEPQPAISRRRQSWGRFSLWSLLVFVLALLGVDSWYAVKAHHAAKQREAIEAIGQLGGYEDFPRNPTDADRSIGQEAKTIEVLLHTLPVTDADLRHLYYLPEITRLSLAHTDITDAGLKYLKGLKQLQDLDLSDCSITNEGLKHLTELSALQIVRLILLRKIKAIYSE